MNKFIVTSFFIAIFSISGCSTSGAKPKNETAQSLQSKIIKNKTTKAELLAQQVSLIPERLLTMATSNGDISCITISSMPRLLSLLLVC
jgi:hypothetical protein